MTNNTEKTEIFAIVELFGKTRISGKLTEHNFGTNTFLRVDVPETTQQPKFTRLLNPSAIYAINPVTEEVMLQMANVLQTKPIDAWDIREMQNKIMALQQPANQPAPRMEERNEVYDYSNVDDMPFGNSDDEE